VVESDDEAESSSSSSLEDQSDHYPASKSKLVTKKKQKPRPNRIRPGGTQTKGGKLKRKTPTDFQTDSAGEPYSTGDSADSPAPKHHRTGLESVIGRASFAVSGLGDSRADINHLLLGDYQAKQCGSA